MFFFVRVGILDMFAEFGNIVHDFFTLIRKRFLDQVHVFSGNGMTSDGMLDNIGTQIQMIINVFIIGMSFGGTFFGCPDKDFIELVPHRFALQDGKEPSGGTNPGRFQKERRLQKAKHNGIAQKGNGKGGRDQLPGDTAENGGRNGTHKTEIQHGLDPIRDTKDIFIFPNDDIDRGDTRNDKETERDGHLSSTHKAGKILPAILEETFTGTERHG
mmetsp:Transcript_19355/g.20780  ORF Transcript_19355/g.20780 Transcript_19355/m.20780 type:complete len:215 (-) Transcript_19355:493-1137(-)